KNENGITLVELLAVLAITGIIVVAIMSVFSTGANSSERTASKQELQQEANLVVEKIRNNYLELVPANEGEEPADDGCTLIEQISITKSTDNKKLMMDGTVLSEGYEYNNLVGETLCRKTPASFKLTIKKGNESY